MNIEIITLEKGYAVKFPFELKDNFKTTFKSAKWNPFDKQWEVGPRALAKLLEWREAAESVAEELAITKAQEAEEVDLDTAKAELRVLKATIIARRQSNENHTAMLAELKAARTQIETIHAEIEAEDAKLLQTRKEIKQFLSRVIDFDKIESAKSRLAYLHNLAGTKAKFKAEQSKIRDELVKLRSTGFTSPALEYLYYMNYNRPDRDSVSNCPDLLEIKPYSEQ